MADSLERYLSTIGATPLLTKDDERTLAKAMEAGRDAARRLVSGEDSEELEALVRAGADAKAHFIRANLRLVVSIARKHPKPQGMDISDLIQEGNIALEHAVDKFDWRRGFKFSTYATFWIRQGIGRALDTKSRMIRLPSDRAARYRAAARRVEADIDAVDKVFAEFHAFSSVASLDRVVGDDGDMTLGDTLESTHPNPEDRCASWADTVETRQLLSRLDHRARRAVEARFGFLGDPMSYRDVGALLGVTGEAARRLVKHSLAELSGSMAQLDDTVSVHRAEMEQSA